MGYTVRSARGTQVDFDLLRIKQEMMGINVVDVSTNQPIIKSRQPSGNIVPTKMAMPVETPEGWITIEKDEIAGENFDEENTDPIPEVTKKDIQDRE